MRSATVTVVGALALVTQLGCAAAGGRSEGTIREAVVDVLRAQVEAWNRGDLEGFMQGYWQSPELLFTSGGRIQRGWRTTLDRYRSAYGSAEAMGTLSFSGLEVYPLGRDSAWVLGRWLLSTGQGERGGVFTLVFQRIEGRWVIIHDHTTEADESTRPAS